jgi:FGGY-family pentulose kinase
MVQHNVDPTTIRGIGFDATCSLAVFNSETDDPVCVTGPDFDNRDGNDRNVVLWLDHRPVEETKQINATGHNLLRYVGGKMSIEMEIPKVLWLKNNMPKEKFDKCKFYDLADALTHLATGNETRSFCSVVCKQGYVPVGVDGSVKGWQEDFLKEIGLEDLCEDNFKRLGGVNGVVNLSLTCSHVETYANEYARTANISLLANRLACSANEQLRRWGSLRVSPSGPVSSTRTQAGSVPWAPKSNSAAMSSTQACPRTISHRQRHVSQPWQVHQPAIWL